MSEARRSLLSCEADCKDGVHSPFCIPNRIQQAYEAAARVQGEDRTPILLGLGMLSGLVVRLEHER
jgi:hypothetical protein